MDLGRASRKTLTGRLLRAPLRLIPSRAAVPILQGRFRGMSWIAGSFFPGCWLGTYEYRKRLFFEASVPPGSIVFDIGAHVGYFTLLSSALVGRTGRVYAFEPLPRNLRYLREHLRLNGLTNVEVIAAAVSAAAGTASFDQGPPSARGSFARIATLGPLRGPAGPAGEGGPITVRTISLDEEVALGRLPLPNVMKIDVERGESLVLSGARTLLATANPTIVLSTHGPDVHAYCTALLASLRYSIRPLPGERVQNVHELIATKSE